MQVLLEKSNGQRSPVNLGTWGIDRIKLDNLIKLGHVYHVIRTDKVEVIRLSNSKGMN